MNVRPAGRDWVMTGLMGYLPEDLTIAELTAVLGPEVGGDGEKTEHEWRVRIDGVLVTVYDYKGHRWHVGGDRPLAFKNACAALGLVIIRPSMGGSQPGLAVRA